MIFQEELIRSLRANSKRIAIETGTRSWTFAEVLAQANEVTAFLLGKNLQAGTPVGIALTNRVDIICSMIGIINARCTLVPLNPDMPEKRTGAMIEDIGLQYLLVPESDGEQWTAYDRLTCFTVRDTRNPDKTAAPFEDYPVGNEDDSIYIYFTSGSTGKPKGVVGKNDSLVQFIKWQISEFELDNTCRVSQLVSPYFDAFLRDIFIPLFTGGVICIPGMEDDFFTPATIISWINTCRITTIHCVPSVFRIINDPSLTPSDLPDLQYMFLSGEKINPAELKNWYKVHDERITLVNFYGPTETTMIKSFYRIKSSDTGKMRISIGKPMDGTVIRILQKDLRPCPRYVTGELFILTPYATKGYLNDPELTHDKFVAVPDANGGTGIAFKTGDKARILDDDNIELIGRDDKLVKIRGIRVGLDEIEAVLFQSGLVKNVVVVKRDPFDTEDAAGAADRTSVKESLQAFVIPSDKLSDQSPEQQLLEYASQYLPSYMVPSALFILQEFPLLSNGKIDYSELKNYKLPAKHVSAADETEIKLAGIWKDILGEGNISVEDNFHQIGGNSLSIMRLIARIYKEFHVRIELSELFSNLTIRKQAQLIKKATTNTDFDIAVAPVKEYYPLSSAQERIYYQYRADRSGTAYNMPALWEIKENMDTDRAENAFRQLIQRHESLRTVFTIRDNRIYQQVKDSIDFSIKQIHAHNQPVQEVLTSLIVPFDLANGPLIRCYIIITDNVKVLLVDMHHIICDGVSQVNLLSDFLQLYEGKPVQPLRLQYKDYAEWEYNFRATPRYIQCREFWLGLFESGIPVLRLPVSDHAAVISPDGNNAFFSLDKTTIDTLVSELKSEDITLFSTLFAFYFIYLVRLTGKEDIVIGINTSGRTQPDLEEVVGMFAKTLPIRFRLLPDMSFRENVKSIHQLLVEANSKQAYDLVDMVAELNKNRKVAVKGLFDTMLVFQNFEPKHSTVAASILSDFLVEKAAAKYPVSLFISERADVLECKLEYLDSFFSKEDIGLLEIQFKALVELAAKHPDTKVADILTSSMGEYAPVNNEVEFKF